MSISNEQFLAALEASRLLPPEAIKTLRGLVADAKGSVHARHLAKWTVDHGHLTPFQAKEMLAGRFQSDSKKPARPAPKASEDDLLIVDDKLEVVDDKLEVVDDNLEVVDDDLEVVEEAPPPRREAPASHATAEDELEVVEDEEDLTPPKGQPTFRDSPPRPAARRQPPSAALPPPAAGTGFGPLESAMGYPTAMGTPGSSAPLSMSTIAQPRLPTAGKRPKPHGNIWDSTLLYWGGGTLLALVIVGAVLLWRVYTVSGDEAFRLANDDYNNGSYANAINKFDVYLEKNPKHPFVSLARVRRGLAQMRQVVDSGSDWPRALEVSKQVLDEISSEKEFPQGQGELAAMLPKIADGLAIQAEKQRQQRLVDLAKEAVGLVDKFVPKSQRPAEQMQDVENRLALTVRSLERSDRLAKAVAEIRQATEAGDTSKAYAARNALLSTYPDLEGDAGLQEAVLAASQSERSQVQFTAEPAVAEASEPASPLAGSVTLATTSGTPAAGVEGRVVFALVEGAAYGLDAASGKVLWRRFVGFDTDFVPVPAGGGGDALLVDSRAQELVRVEAATGKLRWRRRIGEPLAGGPVVLRDGVLLVATRSGRLLSIDGQSGASAGALRLPQQLSVPAAADLTRRKLKHYYQLGEHSNLYVLSAEGNTCEEVVYLGHERQAVVVPPVVMNRYILIAENVGLASGSLRVLVTDEQGLGAHQVQRVALNGHVHTPLLATSKELLVVTDRGALYSFEAGAPDKDPSLTLVAQKAAESQESFARYLHVQGAQFWVAENQLTKFDVQSATGQLTPQWIKHAGEAFLQAPVHEGEYLYHVRRRPGLAGATVTAANMSDGAPVWETHVGAPLAGPPVPGDASGDEKSVLALTTSGGLFQLAPLKVRGDQSAGPPLGSVAAARGLLSDAAVAPLGGGLLAAGSAQSGDRVVVYDPRSAGDRLRRSTLPDALACAPIGMAGKLMAPGKIGQVSLIDPASGQPVVEPFQPGLATDAPPAWVGLAALGDKEALVSDGHAMLYRIGIVDQPRPHLAALAEADVDPAIVSPIAVLGGLAIGVDAAGRVLAFRLPDLKQAAVQENGSDVKLTGGPSWGPARVGQHVLLATEDQELLALDAEGKVAWSATLGRGKLVGAADTAKGQIVVASAEGMVWALDAETGHEAGQVDIGQPLAAGPVVAGAAVVLAGHDGTLDVLPVRAIESKTP